MVVHGVRTLAQARKASRAARMASEGASGAAQHLPNTSGEVGVGVSHGGMPTTHKRHVKDTRLRWVISPNTWQTAVWVRWNAILGWIWAKLHLRPKMKFEDHMMLFDFYSDTLVIRVLV
jgi:hypothetical protein